MELQKKFEDWIYETYPNLLNYYLIIIFSVTVLFLIGIILVCMDVLKMVTLFIPISCYLLVALFAYLQEKYLWKKFIKIKDK